MRSLALNSRLVDTASCRGLARRYLTFTHYSASQPLNFFLDSVGKLEFNLFILLSLGWVSIWIYLYMYICLCTCAWMCTYAYTYTYMWTCTFMLLYLYICRGIGRCSGICICLILYVKPEFICNYTCICLCLLYMYNKIYVFMFIVYAHVYIYSCRLIFLDANISYGQQWFAMLPHREIHMQCSIMQGCLGQDGEVRSSCNCWIDIPWPTVQQPAARKALTSKDMPATFLLFLVVYTW